MAKQLEREPSVISSQTKLMEKDGLIKRNKNAPKSNLLTLVLTTKGWDIIKANNHSESIQKILGSLSQNERQQLGSILNKVMVKSQKYRPTKS